MNVESLLQQFDVMVEAPSGAQKLRELILKLAGRGEVGPQDPGGGPAGALGGRDHGNFG